MGYGAALNFLKEIRLKVTFCHNLQQIPQGAPWQSFIFPGYQGYGQFQGTVK